MFIVVLVYVGVGEVVIIKLFFILNICCLVYILFFWERDFVFEFFVKIICSDVLEKEVYELG